MIVYIGCIEREGLPLPFGRIEARLFEEFLEQCMQSASADVLRRSVDAMSKLRERVNGVCCDVDTQSFGRKQFGVLADEGVFRLLQDADEVFSSKVG